MIGVGVQVPPFPVKNINQSKEPSENVQLSKIVSEISLSANLQSINKQLLKKLESKLPLQNRIFVKRLFLKKARLKVQSDSTLSGKFITSSENILSKIGKL